MSAIKAYAICPKCKERSHFFPRQVIEKCRSCGEQLPPSVIEAVTKDLRWKENVKILTKRTVRKS